MNNHNKPSREEAKEAVKTLIRWAGDNPDRPDLIETPERVVKSYEEFFRGYSMEKDIQLTKTFPNTSEYDDIILLRNIRLESYCEHHMVPIVGVACVGYIPNEKVIGLSKIGRIVDFHSKRFQMQEKLTVEIAKTLFDITEPKGVGVIIHSSHQCMTTRGVHKVGAVMTTSHMLGIMRENIHRKEFLELASIQSNYKE